MTEYCNDYIQLFNASLDAIVRMNLEYEIEEVNDSFLELFRFSKSELIGKSLDDFVVNDIDKHDGYKLNKRVLKGRIFSVEGKRIDKFDNEINVMITGIPILSENQVIGAFVIYKNITIEVVFNEKLVKHKLIFESLFKNSNDAIVRIDNKNRILEINERFQTLFGYNFEEIEGQNVDKLISKPSQLEHNLELSKNLLNGEKVVVEGKRYAKDGTSRTFQIQGVPIINMHEVFGGYGIYTDITDRKMAEEEILHMLYHDQLTGVYNRRFFEEEFYRLDIESSLPLSLIVGDVNGLKLTNDAFGHEAGDELLKRMATILKDNLRSGDITARVGGDEFVILLPNKTNEETEKLVKRIKKSCLKEAYKNIEFSMSFGWDTKTKSDDLFRDLFKRAEDMMYRNKLVESPSIRGKMFDTIIKTLHEKNEGEERHSSRVSKYSESIARELNMNLSIIKEIKTAGWLHDIGKFAINDKILDKTGELNEAEWKQIKKHPEIGYRILNSVNEFTELSECILAHHERYDGDGYPKGLIGERIPIQARIIAVADAYDAMTSNRAYSHCLSIEEAIAELRFHSGTQFDPSIVDVFIRIIEEEATQITIS